MPGIRRAGTFVVAALALSVGLAACGGDDDASDGTSTTTRASTTTSAADDDVVYDVDLTGEAVVPGPGDDSTRGTGEISVTPGGTEVCYAVAVEDLAGVTGAHLHEGREGVAGPVAVALETPASGTAEGCVSTSASIVDGLANGSRSFYLQVHTTDRPDGALRGQVTGTGSDGPG